MVRRSVGYIVDIYVSKDAQMNSNCEPDARFASGLALSRNSSLALQLVPLNRGYNVFHILADLHLKQVVLAELHDGYCFLGFSKPLRASLYPPGFCRVHISRAYHRGGELPCIFHQDCYNEL